MAKNRTTENRSYAVHHCCQEGSYDILAKCSGANIPSYFKG